MFVTKGEEYFPPMGIMQIAAIAEERGHSVSVGVLSKEDVHDRIDKEHPDVVAYSGSTGEHKLYFKFNREVRRRLPGIISIMGGPHATFFPEKTIEDAQLDAVCIGEGDYAFPDFLDRVQSRNFKGLDNIMVSPDSRPNLRPLIQDLDSLPLPDRSIFYDSGESGDNPIKHFFVSRGCPGACTYCFNTQFRRMYPGQRYIRKRSVGRVLEEIARVREKWPLKYIKFYDDVFTLKADEWLEEFSKKYPREVGLPFFCLVRADNVSQEVANLLKSAGCRAVSMSIESASERIRKEILNRHMSNEEIKRAYSLFGERGISIQSNNILALPTSTIYDDIATLDFNIECGPGQNTNVIGEFGTAHPYPGTELGRYCKEHGIYDPDAGFRDLHLSYQDSSPLNCFSEREKRMQRNLTMLGTVAVKFPFARNIIVNYLINWPTNPLFFAAFYLSKTTSYMKHIYNLDYSLKDYLRIIPQSLKLDWFKRMGGRKWKKEKD
jgi:radical SAM superfamily enzyme YgiQ (UPF0313 family)